MLENNFDDTDDVNESNEVNDIDETTGEPEFTYEEPVVETRQLRVISSRADLGSIAPDGERKIRGIHLAFRPSSKDLVVIMKKFPVLALVQMPKSYGRSIAGAMKMQLNINHIAVVEGDIWGHRKDINVWANVYIDKAVLAAAEKFED